MENEAATIPQYNKETPATICKRCGFVVKDPNTDFEISPDDNSRMHRLAECFRLVKLAYDSITVVPPENTVEQQSAAFNQGFRGSKPSEKRNNTNNDAHRATRNRTFQGARSVRGIKGA
jgi:transcription initiation factor TFIIIB Brf1 subunit/transcription initiation factor TFIIB